MPRAAYGYRRITAILNSDQGKAKPKAPKAIKTPKKAKTPKKPKAPKTVEKVDEKPVVETVAEAKKD